MDDLLWAVQSLQRRECAKFHMENLEGGCEPLDIPEGSTGDKDLEEEEKNPFHDTGPTNQADEVDWRRG